MTQEGTGMLAKEKWQVRTIGVLEEVFAHRIEQNSQYGPNTHLKDFPTQHNHWLRDTSTTLHLLNASEIEKVFRAEYEEYVFAHGEPTWMHLVREEAAEAFKETDDVVRLRAELLQLAALAVKWVEAIDEREALATEER